ncbi:alpha/beta fold hydrolase [Luteimonas sp. SDU101]|uniref:alpha/beta fold hydrolase n=1 Tax=Luteimonas sp. SDU101 TaxID=3422593 RepID=UPI003EBC610B
MRKRIQLISPTFLLLLLGLLGLAGAATASADDGAAYGPRLEGFDYPHPVRTHAFESQRQQVEMVYLDVPPTGEANGRAALLLHGKNFCAATWEESIAALADAGYRVIAPDHVGFCKSSKPDGYQYALAGLAHNTRGLLASLGIQRSVVVGHSMGGMLAMRYALMYPEAVEHLVLVGPIGLEDWKAKGVPYQPVEQVYASELRTTYDSIREYQTAVYYAGQWRPQFERWARMQAGMYAGPGRDVVAWHQALTFDMLMGQPVVYELPLLRVPTTLFIGVHDRTALGKGASPPEVQARLGDYRALGRRTAEAIPGAVLVEYEDLGHSPHIQDPKRFHRDLLRELSRTSRPAY